MRTIRLARQSATPSWPRCTRQPRYLPRLARVPAALVVVALRADFLDLGDPVYPQLAAAVDAGVSRKAL